MNFNLSIDDKTVRRLDCIAKRCGESRNAVIRRAVQAWLARDARKHWPESVLAFTGDPALPPFEKTRAALREPKADPLTA